MNKNKNIEKLEGDIEKTKTKTKRLSKRICKKHD